MSLGQASRIIVVVICAIATAITTHRRLRRLRGNYRRGRVAASVNLLPTTAATQQN